MSEKPLPPAYHDQVYAGWLGKCIGVHFGGPLEGWTYEEIRDNIGRMTDYLQDGEKFFKPDDDLIMPLVMMHGMAGRKDPARITPAEFGRTWLNRLSRERGAIWRGGYGISSEHTAFINLLEGIQAPRSGSAALNGKALSEQIGGQIFSDIWGLILPNDPRAAADLAGKAARVSHDGEGVHGGRFVAAMVSAAFSEEDPARLVAAGLGVIPDDCEYARMVRDVVRFHRDHPGDWRAARAHVAEAWGYHRYPGLVHIIPNGAVIVLGLLYGGGDFADSLVITNLCGWDTDCNVGNVGAVLGVAAGLDGIAANWRKPLRDFVVSASLVGARNIAPIPDTALFLENCGRRFAGLPPVGEGLPRCHFDYPGSTHGMTAEGRGCRLAHLTWSPDRACVGRGSLRLSLDHLESRGEARVFLRTYLWVDELTANWYEASFSPRVFPGQTVSLQVYLPESFPDALRAGLFLEDRGSGYRHQAVSRAITPGAWTQLEMTVPPEENLTVSHLGVVIRTTAETPWSGHVFVDALDWGGGVRYSLNLGGLAPNGKTTTQFTTCSGYWRVEGGAYCGSGVGHNESHTGDPDWGDVDLSLALEPVTGPRHYVLLRVGGALSGYALGFMALGEVGIYKKLEGEFHALAAAAFAWEPGRVYDLSASARGSVLTLGVDGETLLTVRDDAAPRLRGQIGLGSGPACHTRFLRLDLMEGDRI
jgi:ADP-ribosylglycohydrolase